MQYPLTLLAAPAGFGKTVVLSAWARQHQQSVAWVSLDSSDNDPVQFWTYVLTALDMLHPGLGTTPLSFLQAEQPASIETVLATLMNALGAQESDRIALVLDDYHVIEALPIHRAMTFLLEHLPPQFHLVLASRVDPPLPLSRLRARHQLVELRADDLRFTLAEAAAFLNEIMGFRLERPSNTASIAFVCRANSSTELNSWDKDKLYCSFLAALDERKKFPKNLNYPITRNISHSRPSIVRALSLSGGFVVSWFLPAC